MGKVLDMLLGPQVATPDPVRERAELIEPTTDPPSGVDGAQILPPSRRTDRRAVDPREALGLSMVYRAVGIHTIAAKQMSILEWRERLTPPYGEQRIHTSNFISRPDPSMSRSRFIELSVTSLSLRGNCYWRKVFWDSGEIMAVKVLDPNKVRVIAHKDGEPTRYLVGAEEVPANQIQHLRLLSVPGEPYGLGPIQAAQTELRGALDTRDYSSNWFDQDPQPSGILSTDSPLTPGAAKQAKTSWKESLGGHRDIMVLGSGLDYKPIFLSPKDVQFLESKQFTTTEIARMFGVPSSLMLAAVEGNTQTYQNVEQDWLGFIRFSHMQYLIEIEEALTSLLPAGRFAKFNIEALLRSDTTTRYASYASGIQAGWMKRSEVRKFENMDEIAGIDDEPLPKQKVETNDEQA